MTRWVCYEMIYRTFYEGDSESQERVIDFDNDRDVLLARVNRYLALENTKTSYRGQQLIINPATSRSQDYSSNRGGCGYECYFSIEEWKELPQ